MEHVITVNPANMAIHVEGYGDMTEDVARELAILKREEIDRIAAKAQQRQNFLAREFGETQTMSFGEVVGQIDEGVYQHWIDRYGVKFWQDKSNRDWFLKKHPECRVRARSARTTVVVERAGYRVNDKRAEAGDAETERKGEGEKGV